MKRPRKSGWRASIIAATLSAFGLGGLGGLESLPDANDRVDATIETQSGSINLSPSDHFWKATLALKTQEELDSLLMREAQNGDSWRVRAALEAGANVNAKDGWAATLAARNRHADVLNVLKDFKADMNATTVQFELFSAAMRGDTTTVVALVEAGADIHAHGEAVLLAAAQQGNLELVDYALARGADAKAFNSEALVLAARGGHRTAAAALILNGADVNAQNGRPLAEAAARSHTGMISTLIAHNAKADINFSYAARISAAKGNLLALQALVGAGADIRVFNHDILFQAVYGGHRATVDWLLSMGADPKAQGGAIIATAKQRGFADIEARLNAAAEKSPSISYSATYDYNSFRGPWRIGKIPPFTDFSPP